MGSIVDRAREHLGSTDKAIIAFRRILQDLIKDVREGKDPAGSDPSSYRNVRAADLMISKDVPWQEGAKNHLVARW